MTTEQDIEHIVLSDKNVLQFATFATPPSAEWQMWSDVNDSERALYSRPSLLAYEEIVTRAADPWPRDVLLNVGQHWLQPCLQNPETAVMLNHTKLFLASDRTNINSGDPVTAIRVGTGKNSYWEPIIGSFIIGSVARLGGGLYVGFDVPQSRDWLAQYLQLQPLGPLWLSSTAQVVAEEGIYSIDVEHWRLVLDEPTPQGD